MAQLAVLIAGSLLIVETQASDVAEADPSAVQGFLSKYMTAPTQRAWTWNVKHGSEGTGAFEVIDDKPALHPAPQKLLPKGNNTPMFLCAVGAGLFVLVMMLRVRIRRGLRPVTVLASNGALASDMSRQMVPGLGDNILEMKSHASGYLNSAAFGQGISDSQGSKACAQYLHEAELKHGIFSMLVALGFPVTREAGRSRSGASWKLRANHVSDDLEWDPLTLLPSDPTIGWQPAVFAVDLSSSNIKDKQLPWIVDPGTYGGLPI